jgi:hypothetical protein
MGGKPRQERVPITATIPLCRGYNYHVFGLGEAKCSICGWDRYAHEFLNQTKTCPHCGETWNDCLVDHYCRSLLGAARRVVKGEEDGDPAIRTSRFAEALLRIERLAREHDPFGADGELARDILDVLEER